jgi:hypothetical protein
VGEVKRAAALALLIFLACSPPHVDRARWLSMPPSEKVLYVKQLLGHEQAKAAKGGTPRAHPLPAEEYVRRIDAAYARGETRDVDAVFANISTSAAPGRARHSGTRMRWLSFAKLGRSSVSSSDGSAAVTPNVFALTGSGACTGICTLLFARKL